MLDLTCKFCGGPIGLSSARTTRTCRKCAGKIRSAPYKAYWEKYNKEHPHYCVVCGKQIIWNQDKEYKQIKTCSQHCKMLYIQSKKKETKEHLEERIRAYIKEVGHFMYATELMSSMHISQSLIKSRGVDINAIMHSLGYYPDWNRLNADEIRERYKQLLLENHGISVKEATSRLHVSLEYMNSLGVYTADIRKEIGLHTKISKTKEEIEALVFDWLKQQPVYCTCTEIKQALKRLYNCTFQGHKIDYIALNKQAGHVPVYMSYHEDVARHMLLERGFSVETQKTFPDCKLKRCLKFDFWLPDYGVLIEVDGEQHHREGIRKGVYERAQLSDAIKNKYAEDNHIPLFRIDVMPPDTFKERFIELMDKITGLPRVSEEVHTDLNCGEPLTDNAEDNPQPSSEDWYIQPDLGF